MVRARLRDVLKWFITGIDDILVERTWRALRRGDGATAVRTWRELVGGFPGCAFMVVLAIGGLLAFLILG